MKRSLGVVSFLVWTGILLSAYYVYQKPGMLYAFAGLAATVWTLVVAALLLFNAYSVGRRVIFRLGLASMEPVDRLFLALGVGIGVLGLLGLLVSALQLARAPIFLLLLLASTIYFFLQGDVNALRAELSAFKAQWTLSLSQYNFFTKLALLLLLSLSFLLTLAPQFEAFDALLYHLAQPARVLQDGGLRLVNVPHFWFPNLTENLYLWALALGSERAAQMMHLTWGILAALLLWRWAVRVWDIEIGRKTLLLLAAIPSLPMLASWAYADLALAFYAIATLYSLTSFQSTKSSGWLRLAGVMAGLAMAVKYTSFTVPLAGGLLILLWGRSSFSQAIVRAAQFSLVAFLIAAPWYLRNAIVMDNPFYPFVFGGEYWDSFRAAWYASAGSGIGWDPLQILMLPLNATLGHRDENFYDGRIGPLFLLLAPLALWAMLSRTRQHSEDGLSLQAIAVFSGLSLIAWTLGVISTKSLWQARLLLPALIPFVLPSALGWDVLKGLDTSRFRPSFFSNAVIAAVITLTVFDNAMFVLQRNPLAVALGAQSRQGYIARVNPSYAALMQLVEELPEDARLYQLFEPRSYALPRYSQPDPINDNFFHDLYVHKTPAAIVNRWKADGYTHVLVYERGLKLSAGDTSNEFVVAGQSALAETIQSLQLVHRTPDEVYSIYRIP